MHDIIIVGAGTAGMTAAIYARRAGKTVLLLESEVFGGQITHSPCVENYPGIPSLSGNEFASRLLDQAMELGAEVELERVVEIRQGNPKTVVTEERQYECRSVVIASGGRHRKLGIAREDEFSGAGVSYCAVCDGAFFKGKSVAVVGGGNAALSDAAYLSDLCGRVYLVHRRDSFRGEERAAQLLSERENVEFVLNSAVSELLGKKSLEGIVVEHLKSGEKRLVAIDGLFVAIGMNPQNEPFRSVVRLDGEGYVDAGEDCVTSAEGIFAAGDCRRKAIRQLTTAAADGAVAGLSACRFADTLR